MFNLESFHGRWEEKRDGQFLDFLEVDSCARVVDLGCGDGRFSLRVASRIGCDGVVGVDVEDGSLELARSRGVDVMRLNLDSGLPFSDESFDVIVSNQVLEHLWFPVGFVYEVFRVLRSGGYAVLSTENLSSWDNIVSLLLGFTPFSMEFDRFVKFGNPLSPHNGLVRSGYPPHTRVLTVRGLSGIFDKVGFSVEGVRGSGYLPFNFLSDLDVCHSRFVTFKVRK